MGINGIPEIQFMKKHNTVLEFEIIPLANLYKRYQEGRIDFDIQSFHRLQFNVIIFIEKGFGKHFVDFRTYDYESGDLIFVARNQVHAFDIVEKTNAWMVLFTTEFLMNGMIHQEVRSINNLLRNMFKSPIMKRLGNNETVKALFHALAIEYRDDIKKNKIALFRHLLVALVIKLNTLQDESSGEKANTDWQKIMHSLDKAIEDDSYKCRDAGKYARRLGCSYKHLNTVCKSLMGQTVKQYIDYFITLEIKRYLATTDLTVKELCFYFDFDEETNFVKFFKKHSGTSPKKFRDQLLR